MKNCPPNKCKAKGKLNRKDLIKSFVLKYEDEIGRAILFDDDENQKK